MIDRYAWIYFFYFYFTWLITISLYKQIIKINSANMFGPWLYPPHVAPLSEVIYAEKVIQNRDR